MITKDSSNIRCDVLVFWDVPCSFVTTLQDDTKDSSNTRCVQWCATSPPFLDNLHFEQFVKSVNHKPRLKYLTNCSKWRVSKKRGLVAYVWMCWFQILDGRTNVSEPGVCHSSPFFRQSPFRTFRQKCQPQFQVEMFDEMFEMETV
jgi:hypothetical protein